MPLRHLRAAEPTLSDVAASHAFRPYHDEPMTMNRPRDQNKHKMHTHSKASFMTRLLTLTLIAGMLTGALRHASAQPASPSTPRRITNDSGAFPFAVSRDGSLVLLATHAFVGGTDADPAHLVVHDVRTNAVRTLSAGPSTYGPPTRPAGAFSPDLKRVAYAWTELTTETPVRYRSNLMVTDLTADASPRVLAGEGAIPHGWSPDGKSLLILQHAPGASVTDPTFLRWLDVANGSTRDVKRLEAFQNGASPWSIPRLSPNGQLIAFAAIARPGIDDRHIFVIDAAGQQERQLATLPGSNVLPVWMPDNTHVVFVNIYEGRRTLYSVDTSVNMRSQPLRLVEDFNGDPIGTSASGDLFYSITNATRFQLLADHRAGRATVTKVFEGLSGMLSKTNQLAYLRINLLGFVDIVVQSPDGREQTHQHPAIGVAPPQWLSDGSAVVVYVNSNGDGGRPGGSFYKWQLRTNEFQRLFARDTADFQRSFVGVLSPDDKTFYAAARPLGGTGWDRVVGIDMATGVERTSLMFPTVGWTRPPAIAVSPDGASLVLRGDDGRIMTVEARGQGLRELTGPYPGFTNPFGINAPASLVLIRWLPDASGWIVSSGGDLRSQPSLMKVTGAGIASSIDLVWPASAAATSPAGPLLPDSLDISVDGATLALSVRGNRAYGAFSLQQIFDRVKAQGRDN